MNFYYPQKTILLCLSLFTLFLFPGCNNSNSTRDHWNAEDSDFILEGLSIDQMQQKFAAGELTSKQVVKLYLDRIAKLDQSGPELRAVLETNPDALRIAEMMDK